jgi:hypothetical protein
MTSTESKIANLPYNPIEETDFYKKRYNIIPKNTLNKVNTRPIFNTLYIPFDRNSSLFDDWLNKYREQLVIMFRNLITDLQSKFSNTIDTDFYNFCRFIYDNSSGYI